MVKDYKKTKKQDSENFFLNPAFLFHVQLYPYTGPAASLIKQP